MTSRSDFTRQPILETARLLGLTVRQASGTKRSDGSHPESLWIQCPQCQGDSTCLLRDDNAWYCFACREAGDSVSLVAAVRGIELAAAVEWMAQAFDLTLPDRRESTPQK